MLRWGVLVTIVGCWRGSGAVADTPLVQEEEPRVVGDGGALVVRERVLLEGRRRYTRICVQDKGRIDVEGSAEIVLTGNDTTVIGGGGIGPRGDKPMTVRIVAEDAPEIFVLFDNDEAKVTADLAAPRSKVHVAITGKAGLVLNGKAATVAHYAGWGIPETFPACR